jgi:acyl carrier protein
LEPEIANQLAAYIASDILKQPKKQIPGGTALISTGLVDSFHLVDLAIFVEDRFGVKIDDSELNKETFDTLDQLVALIQRRQG